eukprot:8038844-Heterocapsa_arctica.AAC.1
MMLAAEAGLLGPGSVELIPVGLGPTWGPVNVDNSACIYYDIFDDEDQSDLPTVVEGIDKRH